MTNRIVVIGAGQAAAAFAAKMRELDQEASITLVGEEPVLPYQRPPLSKKYMTGEMEAERLLLRPADWYATNNIACRSNARVTAIDPSAHTVSIGDETIPYHKLLIATGSTPRKLPADIGGDLAGVFTVRDLSDADAISPHMKPGASAVVIGGGYIGLEAAAVLSQKGMKVTVIEMADRILKRVAASETADSVKAEHERRGVTIMDNTALDALVGEDGHVKKAVLKNGDELPADLVVVGIGVTPNDQLAREAGLACSNGIDVDANCRTSEVDILAAGDVTNFEFPAGEEGAERIRLESVQNAIDQAEHAAKAIAGSTEPYTPIPWFWSDQYDMKLQIAGLNTGYDETVVRQGSRDGGQSVWYFRNGKFLAVDAINDSKAYMFGKKILELGKTITPEQAGDSGFDLRELIKE